MTRKIDNKERGSTVVIVIAVVATILVMLGSAVSYTQHVSRLADRSRKAALALEVGDGHLEYLFTNWRNIYRKTWTTSTIGALDASLVGTNYFYTDLYKPGVGCTYNGGACPTPSPIPNMNPVATPVPISLPSPSANFPNVPGYSITQYRIQAVDPMLTLSTDGSERAWTEADQTQKGKGARIPTGLSSPPSGWAEMNPASPPPAAYGPNYWQYSFYYLASVDVSIPAMTGTVTAKVRRVFEKKFDNPWTYAMYYIDDLELSPTTSLSINGPVHTNANLYISTNNVTATNTVGYSGQYMNGYSPNDTSSHSGSITAPNFAAGLPPVQETALLPFGWDLNLSNTNSGTNNDSYHEILEPPVSGTDPLASIRMYNQAGIKIVVDSSNNVTYYNAAGNSVTTSSSAANDKAIAQLLGSAVTKNVALWDSREGAYVRTVNIDVGQIATAVNNGTIKGFNGVLYVGDTTTNGTSIVSKIGGTSNNVVTTQRAVRLVNGSTLPSGYTGSSSSLNNAAGLTVASSNPIYIQGNYNTGSGTVPSNNGTYTDPDATGYTRKPAAIMGDAINVLSGAWADTNSEKTIDKRTASNTTVNAALVGGIVPSSSGNYSGGAENFVRYLEDWTNRSFTYYGSMAELFQSKTGIGIWDGSGTSVYKAPTTSKWYYDDTTFSGAGSPPGNLQIAAYLQQQRWYQVY
jgi:hypothetical protein